MEGFDAGTMHYPAVDPMSLSNATQEHLHHLAYPPVLPYQLAPVAPDHYLKPDPDTTFVGSDDGQFSGEAVGAPQPPATLTRMPSSYDNAYQDGNYQDSLYDGGFSEIMSGYDSQFQVEHPTTEHSVNAESELLNFSVPKFTYSLFDQLYSSATVSMQAQLNGMFFLAESPWAQTNDGTLMARELTCYRRNLFQVTGNIVMPRSLRYILTDQGENIMIMSFELTISAKESVEGNSVKIISVPWKTPAGNPTPAEEKVEKEPPAIPLDLASATDMVQTSQGMDTELVNIPVAWRRLQFRIATANNGRRKELQQHFVVHLKLVATLQNGMRLPICESHSNPIIVRGRSPRNFQQRKDVPISGGGGTSRKHLPAQPARTNSREQLGTQQVASTPGRMKPPTSAPVNLDSFTQPPPFPEDAFNFPVPTTNGQAANFMQNQGSMMPPLPSPGLNGPTHAFISPPQGAIAPPPPLANGSHGATTGNMYQDAAANHRGPTPSSQSQQPTSFPRPPSKAPSKTPTKAPSKPPTPSKPAKAPSVVPEPGDANSTPPSDRPVGSPELTAAAIPPIPLSVADLVAIVADNKDRSASPASPSAHPSKRRRLNTKAHIRTSPMAPPAQLSIGTAHPTTDAAAKPLPTPALAAASPTALTLNTHVPAPSVGPVASPTDAGKTTRAGDSPKTKVPYEFFALEKEDWVAPVDGVWRPHVVHHIATAVAQGGKARSGSGVGGLGGRNGRKVSTRYFQLEGEEEGAMANVMFR